ncbi:MAG TPA: hypothetical protein PK325_03925 [Cyclobacteriaceae bacterium]|nr:hypothetical protein [Cyclobacteriaceae bacterium]HMV07366.1 hypothetical protein [Cyclobacteriaceae bacterium]HMV88844.1 hypothetical protein [Cyclobacteriaceae bacterium]HMW99279.1 hypothetical protein [Cyclobacteriaceae bacterium]HMX48932.1 hypothetical protein [Cyclobacteriaceae bacterium]
MPRISLILLLVLCATTASFAQSKKKQKKVQSSPQQPNSLTPYFPAEDYEPEKKGKTKKSKSRKVTHNAEDEHEARMKEVVKAHRKAEKEMLKPQYADFTYFGHKRKPKKHKPGKMKFCKECEIWH